MAGLRSSSPLPRCLRDSAKQAIRPPGRPRFRWLITLSSDGLPAQWIVLVPSTVGGRLVHRFSRVNPLMKTYSAKPGEIHRDWYVVDADGKTLGRLATQIADRLRGKGKPQFTPHVDTGDFVIVVNAEKIAVTGNKMEDKLYYRHSGYPGGLRVRPLREQLERRPTEVLRKAVKGMLPKNKLSSAQINKLKIYAGPDHPHEAQAPKPF
jgi:large subunit ribosomal protein L13